jgi:hypothetical protein
MATLATQTIPVDTGENDLAGALAAAAAGGDTAEVGEGIFLVVLNGDASPHTATVATPSTFHGLAIPDVAVVVAADDIGILPLSPEVFRGAANRATITYDAVTSVTVGVFKLGR